MILSKGIDWSDTESYRSTLVHHPWRKSDYLHKRKEELKEVIDELFPHKPVCITQIPTRYSQSWTTLIRTSNGYSSLRIRE